MTEDNIIIRHALRMTGQMLDSSLETTRVYWRQTFFNATEAEAHDPRPFAEILAERGK
jgi:hypothetical protein